MKTVPNPRRKVIPVKVSESTYLQIQKAAAEANMGMSTWVNGIVEKSLGVIVLPALPKEVRLLSDKVGPNARCIYCGVEISLLELARRFQISFVSLHNKLKGGESLSKVVAGLEERLGSFRMSKP